MKLLHRDARKIAERLHTYPAFATCHLDDLIALVEVGQQFEAPPGWVMMSEGVPADAVYVILDGTADVYKARDVIATVGPGDIVGEMTLLAGGQRRATITTKTTMSGVRIEHDWLTKLIAKKPNLSDILHTTFRSHQQTAAGPAAAASEA